VGEGVNGTAVKTSLCAQVLEQDPLKIT